MSDDILDTDGKDFDIKASDLMPSWFFWGQGIVLVKREDWSKANRRIEGLLRELHKVKKSRKVK